MADEIDLSPEEEAALEAVWDDMDLHERAKLMTGFLVGLGGEEMAKEALEILARRRREGVWVSEKAQGGEKGVDHAARGASRGQGGDLR
jgi:hypothetical protein